jgi:glucose-6-phosphate 1-dehydrogenase
MVTGNPLRLPGDRRLARIAGPSALVIFGVTGDLARKKLLPAIYELAASGLLHPGFSIVGFGRRPWSDDEFRAEVRQAMSEHGRTEFHDSVWASIAPGIRFVSGDFDDPAAFADLRDTLDALEGARGTQGNHAYYLSIPPHQFPVVTSALREAGLAATDDGSWRRVIVEKPFGHDLASAKALNKTLESVFPPDAVFRIDHYLGKETVQNMLAVRFANSMYEPVWNSHYIDHVQITMAEDIGVGTRAGYYDGIGAARDVIQNHLLQLLALTAMEEPVSFHARDVRIEKEKVLQAITPPSHIPTQTARGRYVAGWQGGNPVSGYLDEEGIPPESTTETYAAVRLEVSTRRWQGVPFYLRTGKRLGRRVTEIAVVFKDAPAHLFPEIASGELGQNALVIRVQPDEGVTMRFASKVPGPSMQVRNVTMDFGYGHAFTEASPEAYERLILDVLLGDPPLFPRQREVELSWRILDPIIAHWESDGVPDDYIPGTWGPHSADQLVMRDNRVWRRP